MAQPKIEGTTNVAPKGTFFKNGQLNLSPGYKISFSKDEKIGTISKQNGLGATALVKCSCKSGTGAQCKITSSGSTVECGGLACCIMSVTTGITNTTTLSGAADSSLNWKTIDIPKTSTKTTSN